MNIQRLRGLIRKELLQIIRDPSAIAIAFILPIVLLFIFGYGVSLDSREVPIAIVVEHPTVTTSSFIASLQQSPFFVPKPYADIMTAQRAISHREANGILWLRNDFSRQLLQNNTAPIGVFLNGVNANDANILAGYLQGAWQIWLQQYGQNLGSPLMTPVSNQSRIWFNPALRSRDYLVPGLIAVIMTLSGALLTSLVVAREWERGTMEALMATPVTMNEILLGKIIPYFFLGMGGMLFSVWMAVTLFAVPLVGHFGVLLGFSALFLLTALGMGLLISSIAHDQFVAGQAAIIVTFLPAFILSGFIFDIQSMPRFIQLITYIIPARYFVAILQTLFLAGNVWYILWWNGLALLLMIILFLGMVFLRARKRLS